VPGGPLAGAKTCFRQLSQGITGPELIAFIDQDEAMRPDGKRGDGLFASLRSLRAANGDRRDLIAKVFHGSFNRMPEGRAAGGVERRSTSAVGELDTR
jgi:hypothetical protein